MGFGKEDLEFQGWTKEQIKEHSRKLDKEHEDYNRRMKADEEDRKRREMEELKRITDENKKARQKEYEEFIKKHSK